MLHTNKKHIMTTQTNSVKALIKDLENGKRQLKAEYDRSMGALDEIGRAHV